ncbi:hypothetical protein [Mesorhizobium sp. J428]|uniref:hypothetical protein n=1 Tax=Mesorhizobium sp. J428 TaxID=2898440 RepID=UPI002151EA05|nr:hypothetical protein [Mesorhizobium sp. J428]MCR5858411.1 hypothetical protein [Mesorhizobium sp. J428]
MPGIVYRVVQHDGGWAYKVGDVFSETFPNHDSARNAALAAANEHRLGGRDAEIEYQDSSGAWRTEHAAGSDRPETEVEG